MKKIYILMIAILIGGIAKGQWQHSIHLSSNIRETEKKGDTIFVLSGSSLLKSDDNGNSWSNIYSCLSNSTLSLCPFQTFTQQDSIIYIGSFYYFNISKDFGNTWLNNNTLPNITSIATKDSIIIIAYNNATYKSTDYGLTWAYLSNGPNNYNITTIAIFDNDVYLGTNYQGVYKTTLNGTSWTQVNNNMYQGYIGAFAKDGNNIYAASSHGLYKTSNNAVSWTKMNTFEVNNIIVIDTLLVVTSQNNGVFLSKDEGQNWISVIDGLPSNNSIKTLINNDSTIFLGISSEVYTRKISDFYVKDTITANTFPLQSGVVSGTGNFDIGQTITIKATPLSGYKFVCWNENGTIVSVDSAFTFTVSGNRNLTAVFIPIFSITANCNLQSSGIISGDGYYTNNQICNLKASRISGYVFVSWTENGNIVSVDSNYLFVVTSNRNLVANFFPRYIVTTVENPAIGGTTTGGGFFNVNQVCTIKAFANPGYKFLYWRQNFAYQYIVSYDTAYSFNVNYDGSYMAVFAPTSFNVYTNSLPNNGGFITGGGIFQTNSLCTLKANAFSGYQFLYWSELGSTLSTDTIYSFVVDEEKVITANFSSTISIENNKIDNSIDFYPNPATNTLTLNLSQLQKLQNATVSIYDIQGKQLLQQIITEAQTQIDISSFAKGIYIVKLQTDKETLQSKFVKE